MLGYCLKLGHKSFLLSLFLLKDGARQSLPTVVSNGLIVLYQVSIEHWGMVTAMGKPECFDKMFPHCHFVYQKSTCSSLELNL
jgi:hypothetical protein